MSRFPLYNGKEKIGVVAFIDLLYNCRQNHSNHDGVTYTSPPLIVVTYLVLC